MHEREIMVLSDEESELADLLIRTGIPRTVSQVLVFLANIPIATSRDIERGTDLRQPEVSLAIRYLTDRHWIGREIVPTGGKGRPVHHYSLSLPFQEIVADIEKEKKIAFSRKLSLIRILRNNSRSISG